MAVDGAIPLSPRSLIPFNPLVTFCLTEPPLMNVNDMARNWTRWGQQDPQWAVLTHPGKEQNRWDPTEFLATRESTVQQSIDWLDREGLSFPRGLALDVGCGVGRLTRALARHFEFVHGVDIPPSIMPFERVPEFFASLPNVIPTMSDNSSRPINCFQELARHLVLNPHFHSWNRCHFTCPRRCRQGSFPLSP
jgi:SAM-dependent methyltransferase